MEQLDPLTGREREDLSRMLERGARRNGSITLSQLDGLLCAVAVGPNTLPPSAWLPMIYGEDGPSFASLEEAQRYLTLVMRHYNDVVRATTDGTYIPLLPKKLPRGAEHRAQPWATGFVLGMSLDEAWKSLIADRHDAMMVMPMLVLADATSIVRDATPDPTANESFIAMLPQVVPIIRSYWQQRDEADTRPGRTTRARGARKRPASITEAHDTPTVHRLKAQLLNVKPAIWRRIEIASDAKLAAVSRALLMAMGWTDTHLHAFRVGRQTFGRPDAEFPDDMLDERRYTLAQLLPHTNDTLTFEYDFGDGWEHRVTVEAIERGDPAVVYPRCLAGKRACPPEDCGGPSRYAELLSAIADPAHPEHERMLEWIGPFDPTAFDLVATNLGLDSIFRRRSASRRRETAGATRALRDEGSR